METQHRGTSSATDVAEKANAKIGALARELSEVYDLLLEELDRDGKLMSSVQKRDRKIRELEATVSRLRAHIAKLESSKAVKYQKKYWSIRKKLAGKGNA